MFFVLKKHHLAILGGLLLFAVAFPAILWGGRGETAAAFETSEVGEGARVVVIDAGHGGPDGGAVAGDGTTEAQINLAVALRLEEMLQLAGVETVMVRREDVSVHDEGCETLREKKVSDIHNRAALINATPGAVLLSIHQNSLPQVPSVHGAQAFYNTVDGAAAMAATIQESLNTAINPGNEKQEKAIDSSVYLMKNIQAPGVLVECGFLSNPQETAQLKDGTYQTRMAVTIAAGYLRHTTAQPVPVE